MFESNGKRNETSSHLTFSGTSPTTLASGSKKTVALIDGPNIFFGSKRLNLRIDYKKINLVLSNSERIDEAYFFNSNPVDPSYEQTGFYNFLERGLGWNVRVFNLGKKTLTCSSCTNRQVVQCEKGVDVALATKMMQLAYTGEVKKVVLLSGDGDYCEAINHIQSNFGITVQVVSWRQMLSKRLQETVNGNVILLEDIVPRIIKRVS